MVTATTLPEQTPATPLGHSRTRPGPQAYGLPPWVPDKTGVTEARLDIWRDKGWLTPPGLRWRHGHGSLFDWPAALPQIAWLAQLDQPDGPHKPRMILDNEDAAAGWRLRASNAEWAIRVGRDPWQPTTISEVPSIVAGGHAVTVARIRP